MLLKNLFVRKHPVKKHPAHKDSGHRCLVAHFDKDGKNQDQCMLCARCGKWIRPESWGNPCEVQEDE